MSKQLQIIKVIVSVFLITVILLNINIKDIVISISHANMYLIIFAFFLHLVGVYLTAVRWNIALRTQKILLPIKKIYLSVLKGLFFNNVLPSQIGGDIYRIYDSSKHSKKMLEATSSVIVDRVSGFFVLVLISSFSLVLLRNSVKNRLITVTIYLLLVSFILLGIVIFNKKVAKSLKLLLQPVIGKKLDSTIKRIYNSFYIYKEHKAALVMIVLISLLLQLNVILYVYIISLSLGLKISFIYLCVVVPLITLLLSLPISINGIGVRENAFLYFLGNAGVSAVASVSIAVIIFILRTIVSLIGGFVYLFDSTVVKSINKN